MHSRCVSPKYGTVTSGFFCHHGLRLARRTWGHRATGTLEFRRGWGKVSSCEGKLEDCTWWFIEVKFWFLALVFWNEMIYKFPILFDFAARKREPKSLQLGVRRYFSRAYLEKGLLYSTLEGHKHYLLSFQAPNFQKNMPEIAPVWVMSRLIEGMGVEVVLFSCCNFVEL